MLGPLCQIGLTASGVMHHQDASFAEKATSQTLSFFDKNCIRGVQCFPNVITN